MAQDSDSLRIARERIAKEALDRKGTLDLRELQLTAFPKELSSLRHLRALNFSRTQVSDLSPLAGLAMLQELDCSGTSVEDLSPLTGLAILQELDCSETWVGDLSPLTGLAMLRKLNCSGTQVEDLSPLTDLAALQKLDCSETVVDDLSPLTELAMLQELDCSRTQVEDLSPLTGLAILQELNCYGAQVIDLAPLAGLVALLTLDFSFTQVVDLAPLTGLVALQKLNFSFTQVMDLAPLAGLATLQELYCVSTQVKDLSPLTELTALQELSCSRTQVEDLSPLAGLVKLRKLNCAGTQVEDLSPLMGLSMLQELNFSETQVNDLSLLTGLAMLQELNFSETQVNDLSPLTGLATLRKLRFDNCSLSTMPCDLLNQPSLERLCLFNTQIPRIPAEVLSQHTFDSCLDSLRAYVRALESGSVESADAKLLILGNGRIGKTQICRRLRAKQYDSSVASTHGIRVSSISVPQPEEGSSVLLHLWDFGGQDIYHGTHALFMRTRAIFMLVWIPEAEETSEHDGLIFRNQPLDYWLSYIRNLSGLDNPVLVVQTRCDDPEDEIRHIPALNHALEKFRFCKLLQYSSLNNRGRAALDEALHEAATWLRAKQGIVLLGEGWMRVKLRLEAMRDADAALPAEERQRRTLSQETFHQLCAEGGGDVDSPEYLLQYLHNSGIVFYRPGLFQERIILDQGWALEAIYTVFHREKCYQQLRNSRGRFTRSLLEAFVWQDYSVEEQELFLGMMQSCSICFIHKSGDEKLGIEHEYIAPDLLPDKAEVALELEEKWESGIPVEESTFEYELHHPGLLRSFISDIGSEAGLNALYWKNGTCFYEKTTRSRALIEQATRDGWRGVISIQTQKGNADALLARLTKRLVNERERWAVCHLESTSALLSQRKLELKKAALIERELQPLKFIQEPSAESEYCVSYAWGDETKKGKEREAIVDRLCEEATARGIQILRDKSDLGLGDSLSQFMERIGQADLVFVVLSDKYLKSPNCMFELSEIWRNSCQKEDDFLQRVRSYVLPNTPIFSPLERAEYTNYWEEKIKNLEPHLKFLGTGDFIQYRRMKEFAPHIGNILATITDRRMPRTFDELVQYGFGDLSFSLQY